MVLSSSFYFPLSLLLFILSSSALHSFHDDRQSLLVFRSLITHNSNQSMTDWSSAVPLCNWTAVTCIHRHPFDRVIALNLGAMDLQGTISPSLANLSFLHSLDLSHNALHGHIPPQLGRLFRLRTLSLRFNQLEGSIPLELGSLKQLQFLYLGANSLTEYRIGERVSTQGDVYSNAIILLEMLTRKKPTSDMFARDLNLHKWVNLAFPNKMEEVIDPHILREMDGDEIGENDAQKCLLSLLHVGLLCSKDELKEHPTMRDVSTILERFKNDLLKNNVASWTSKQSISTLLTKNKHTTTRNDAVASSDQSSTF